jgi:quercetin dioxygenase-like cupin family protein
MQVETQYVTGALMFFTDQQIYILPKNVLKSTGHSDLCYLFLGLEGEFMCLLEGQPLLMHSGDHFIAPLNAVHALRKMHVAQGQILISALPKHVHKNSDEFLPLVHWVPLPLLPTDVGGSYD